MDSRGAEDERETRRMPSKEILELKSKLTNKRGRTCMELTDATPDLPLFASEDIPHTELLCKRVAYLEDSA